MCRHFILNEEKEPGLARTLPRATGPSIALVCQGLYLVLRGPRKETEGASKEGADHQAVVCQRQGRRRGPPQRGGIFSHRHCFELLT